MSADAVVREDRPPDSAPAAEAATPWAIGRWGWAALAALVFGGGLMLLYLTRGTTLWFDEWAFVVDRRENTLDAFLEPHVGHLSIVPVALYRVLFATVGIDDYLPYRFMIASGEVAVVGLVFLYAVRRVGPLVATMAAVLVLFNAPAWQNSLWPFQIAWMIAIGAGIVALMLLDRRDRLGDVGACAMVGIALASCGVGIAVLIGVAVELALGRRRWKDAWIVLVPAVPYALWWILYQDQDWQTASGFADSTSHPLITGLMRLPGFEIQSAASTLSSLLGLSGTTPGTSGDGTFVQYGAPILAAALVAGVLRLRVLGRIPVRVVSLAAIAIAFWAFTAITRGAVGEAFTSRYLFVGGVFVPLVAVELARGVRFQRWVLAAFAFVLAGAVLSNLNVYRGASGFMRDQATLTRSALATFDVAEGIVQPGYVVTSLPGSPGVTMRKSDFDEIRSSMGGIPAAPIAEIPSLTETARQSLDRELFIIYKATLGPVRAPVAGAKAPAILPVSGRVTRTKGSCVTLAPPAVGASAGVADVGVTVPAGGLLIRGGTEGASVGLTRFGGLVNPLGKIGPRFAATVTMPPDKSPVPWTARVQFGGTATVCGLA